MKKIISRTYTDLGNGMGHGYAEMIEAVELTDECIERIADAVVRKLGGMVSSCGYWDSESRICSLYRPTAEPRSASCDECEIAKNYNLEDDDSPCLNCEREE